MPVTLHFQDAPTDAYECCSRLILKQLSQNLRHKEGPVIFLVSGGSTPRHVLPLVLKREMQWDRVKVLATDERLVRVDNEDSTEGMIRSLFASYKRPLDYCSPDFNGNAEQALKVWNERIRHLPEPACVGLIGIGEDGHFASIFPGKPVQNARSETTFLTVDTPPHKHSRLSMGLAPILATKCLTLVASGEAKQSMIKAALFDHTSPELVPFALLRNHPDLHIFMC